MTCTRYRPRRARSVSIASHVVTAPSDNATRVSRDDAGRGQSRWWFIVAAVLVAIMGLVSTRMGPADLEQRVASDVRALLGAFAAISVMALGLQLVLVGLFSSTGRPSDVCLPARIAPTIAISIAAGLCAGLGALAVIDSTRTFEVGASLAVGISVVSLVASIPSRSLLLGGERWRDLALVAMLSAGSRLTVTLLNIGDDAVNTVLVGLVVGEVIGASGAMAFTHGESRLRATRAGAVRHLVVGGIAAVGLMGLVALSSFSLSRFLGDQSTIFNQSAAVARLVFIVIFTVAFVFFPAIARWPIGSVELRRSFHGALVLGAGAGAIIAGAVAVSPSTFLSLIGVEVTGPTGAASVTTVRLLAIAFAAYGIAGVSLMQYIAHGSRFALCTWPLIGVMLIAHVATDSAVTLAWCSLAAASILVIVALLPALLRVQPVLRPHVVDEPPAGTITRESLTIVIPSYNPGPIVLQTIEAVRRAFKDSGRTVDIVVVSDGSTDGTVRLLDELDHPDVRHIVHPANRGKGAALRTGFGVARTSRIGFVDSDGDIDPATLVDMDRIQTETGADIVFGSKRHDESTVSVPFIRRVSSRSFSLLIKLLFQLDIPDTQTGIKLYDHEVIAQALPVLEEDGFALDLELFVAARAAGFNNFVEVPVDLVRKGGSTISPSTVLKMLKQTLKIFWRSKITLHYLRAGHSTSLDPFASSDRLPTAAPTATRR
jgi:hypothetical protein